MTFREKVTLEHPDEISNRCHGGVHGCPVSYGYEDSVACGNSLGHTNKKCTECWDREMPEEKSESDNWICKDCHYKQYDGDTAVCTQGDVIICCEDIYKCDAYTKSESIKCAELARSFAEGLAYGLEDAKPTIKDSGARREFETGAVSDIHDGKGRCDLMPLDVIGCCYARIFGNEDSSANVFAMLYCFMESGNVDYLYDILEEDTPYSDNLPEMLLEVSIHFEEGAKKYGEYNWQKGIPVRCHIDSAIRHYLKYLRGDKDEPHDRAFVWRILCCIWTCIHKPELNDYAKKD